MRFKHKYDRKRERKTEMNSVEEQARKARKARKGRKGRKKEKGERSEDGEMGKIYQKSWKNGSESVRFL